MNDLVAEVKRKLSLPQFNYLQDELYVDRLTPSLVIRSPIWVNSRKDTLNNILDAELLNTYILTRLPDNPSLGILGEILAVSKRSGDSSISIHQANLKGNLAKWLLDLMGNLILIETNLTEIHPLYKLSNNSNMIRIGETRVDIAKVMRTPSTNAAWKCRRRGGKFMVATVKKWKKAFSRDLMNFTDIDGELWTKEHKLRLDYVVYMKTGIKGQYGRRDVTNTTKVMEDALSEVIGINDNKNLMVSSIKAPLTKDTPFEVIHIKLTNLGK